MLQGCLLATVQTDLYDDLLVRLRDTVLDAVHAKALKGVVFDMSSVRVLDSYAFNHVAETARMTSLLGVPTLFFGFSPGIVSSLVDLEVDTGSIRSFRTMDDALEHLALGCTAGAGAAGLSCEGADTDFPERAEVGWGA